MTQNQLCLFKLYITFWHNNLTQMHTKFDDVAHSDPDHHLKPVVVALCYSTPGWSSPQKHCQTKKFAIYFACRYCISRGSSVSTRPSLMTDSWLVGIPIYLPIHVLNIACKWAVCGCEITQNYNTWPEANTVWAISLAHAKGGVFERDVLQVEKSWYWCNQP